MDVTINFYVVGENQPYMSISVPPFDEANGEYAVNLGDLDVRCKYLGLETKPNTRIFVSIKPKGD